jgi:GNAT superfamily N-acetyltransferase
LPAVAAQLPAAPYRTHLDDLDWQQTGAVTQLVAWQDCTPVGSGFIHWPGPRDASIATRLPACPEIFRLEVVEKHRSKGVGTALIRALEALALARGFGCVGLGVGTGNPRARVLYERLGYRRVKGSAYIDRREYPDADGRRRVSEEPCIFMTKQLGCAARGRSTPRRPAA